MNTNVIVSLIVNLAAVILPLMGVHVGSEQLTEAIQTLVSVVAGVVIYIEHNKVAKIAASSQAN